MPQEIDFTTPHTGLKLFRYPHNKGDQLRAWDAADEYLLKHLAEEIDLHQAKNILLVNDSFGALSLGVKTFPAFQTSAISLLSDSAVSHRAVQENARQNNLDPASFRVLSSLAFSSTTTQPEYDLVLIKVPKSLAQLEDNLRRINAKINSKSRVIGAGMSKNIHNSTLALFEKYLGATRTSLAQKKARLIFSQVEQAGEFEAEPAKPFEITTSAGGATETLQLVSYPGVFSHGSLDYGTAFMLESMQLPGYYSDRTVAILDLGCGTGVLGILAVKRLLSQEEQPKIKLCLLDESCAAVASAQENMQRLLPENPDYRCIANHCLEGIADNSQDLILNNPPFHDASARTSAIALEMFLESKRVLRNSGQLQVVANRHLGYHKRLKEIFGNSVILASNPKFVVLRAVKQPESSHA